MFKATSKEDSQVNIRHFLILSLGGTPFLHDTIEKMYKENQWEYYEHYRNSELTEDLVIPTYTTKSEEKMKQVAGIVDWCYHHNNFERLFKLIKKGFKFTYQYVEQRKHVDLQEFNHAFMKKKGGADNVSDLELFNNDIICLYLCYRNEKSCNLRNVAGEIFQMGLKDAYLNAITKEINFSKEKQKIYKEQVDALYEEYPIPNKFNDEMNISRLFEYGIERKTEEVIMRDRIANPGEARTQAFKEPFLREIGALSGWFKALGINEMDLTDQTPFSKEDMDIVFMEYLIAHDENDIPESSRDLFIVACIWIQALATHYKETKRLYLDESKEEYYSDIKQRESEIKAKESELRDRERESERKEADLLDRVKKLEEELRVARKSLKEKDEKTKELQDYSKEVHALRTYLYDQEKSKAEVPVLRSVEDMAGAIEQYKVAVFGGHPNWQQKLKEILPGITMIHVDEINKDLSYIDRMDAVFINTSSFNHSFYRKLMARLSKNETKLYYLEGSTNTERLILKMYDDLTT